MFENSALQTTQFMEYTHSRNAKTLAELRHTLNLDWLKNKDYRIINTPVLLEWAISYIEKAPIISVDTETTGLMVYNISDDNPLKSRIVGMSISWERNQGIYIPFRHKRFPNLDLSYALRRLQPYLESKSIITHNGLYDAKVFYDLGIRLNITQDTFLMYFNIDSTVGKGGKGLKAITHRMYGYDVIELSDIFESEKDAGLFAYVDEEVCKAYACADSDHTFMVFMDSFRSLLPGQIKAYQLDIRVQNELVRSEYEGKGIDINLLHKMDAINDKDLAVLENLIYSYVGIKLSQKHGELNYQSRYTFNISSGPDLQYVLFDLLGYAVPEELREKMKADGKVSVDKYTLKALNKPTTTDPDEVFDYLVPEDIMSAIADSDLGVHGSDAILLRRDDLKNKAYKIPALITKYRKLMKLKTSFFAPLSKDYFAGRYFSGIKMARAETGRLVDFIQTLDKGLKKLVCPLKENEYLLDFDFARIEARCMVGLSGMDVLAEHLDDPEADYHREAGSLILKIPAEDMTDAERKKVKSVNFGIPYSMSAYGILQSQYGLGLSKEKRDAALAEINETLDLWYASMTPIKDMLNKYRDQALTPVSQSTLPNFLKDRKIGRISNPLGRTRLFYLDNISKQKMSSIRRQAGNFPIQSFAREIFCTAFCDLDDAMKKAGLIDVKVPDASKPLGYRFENKVKIMAYIHDECLMSIDASVNPYFMYKLINDNCMRHIQGHPTYYCGINVIANWYEGKSSKFEAPVRYVWQMLKQEQPVFRKPITAEETRDQVLAGIREYCLKRVEDELIRISPRAAEHYYDLREIIPKFKNYAVKPLVESHLKLHRKPAKDEHGNNVNDDYVKVSLETLIAYRNYEDNIFVDTDGTKYHFDVELKTAVIQEATDKESVADRESELTEEYDEEDDLTDELVQFSETTFLKNISSFDTLFEE